MSMKLDYNIDFSIAAAIFLSIFLLFVIFSYDLKVRKNRGFLWLIIFILIADIFDIITAYTISNVDVVPVIANIIVNELYYVVLALLGFIFLRYSQAVAGDASYDDRGEHSLPLKKVHIILMTIYLSLLVINIPTGILMTFRDGEYIHGPLYFILFFFPYLEVAFAFTRVIMSAEEFKRRGKRILVWIYFAFCVAAAALQLFVFPKVLISIFAVAIGLTFLMILMETPDYQGMMAVMEKLRDAQQQMREQADLEQRRSQSKTDFLLHLSHELRTPLNAIIGYSELILGDHKKKAAAEDVKKIRTASRNLLSIADNIKNFIEIEDENVSIENENYDTIELIEDMKRKVEFLNADKNLQLHLVVDPDLPSTLYGDAIRIKQLMDTLNSNAIKYTQHGEVDISIEWKANISAVTFTVEDSGIGMKPAELKRISESFFKGDMNGTSSGLGLGLAFATKLLDLMGSKLEYESAYNVGSRFWFTLKQVNVSNDHIGEEKALGLADFTVTKRETAKKLDVLVVDDNQINIDITVRLLSAGGCHVETAMNGQEAIERIRARQTAYDIIFMDHLMPVMDGVEAMDAIRAENLCPDTPVVALTANAVTDVEREYKAHGFAAYMLKPVTQDSLFDTIDRLCGTDTETHEVVHEETAKAPAVAAPALSSAEKRDPMDALSEFLDTKAGLQYCGGMPDFYLDIINDYINGDKRDELSQQLADKDFDNYRIGVHSLKSSSRTIGANELSERAKSLEDACKSGDHDFIEKNHDAVMAEYGELLTRLDAALHPKGADEPAAQPEEKKGRERVLLAVGFDLERNILSYLLGKDYDVIEAPDREYAFSQIENEKLSLAIFDSEMTVGHENEFAELPVPLIFLTDERDRQAKIRSISCGGSDIIERPIDESFMKRRIRGVLATTEAAV